MTVVLGSSEEPKPPKHKLALAAVQNTRKRQAEFDTENSKAPNAELPLKTVKAVTQVKNAIETDARNSLAINYEKPAAEAINKVKQDLATKEIEQRLKQEIERQKLNETLCRPVPVPGLRRERQGVEIATL